MTTSTPKFHGTLEALKNDGTGAPPVLGGMGRTSLTLKKGQLLTPHVHPNANEIAYFQSGTAEVGVVAADSAGGATPSIQVFKVTTGDIVFFPAGFIHYVNNVGEDAVNFVLNFDNPDPELLLVDEAFKIIPAEILAKTFNVKQSSIESGFQHGGVIVPPYPG